MRRLAYQNCNLTIENKNLKEVLDIEILKNKETAEKIYRELQGHGTTYVKKWIKEQFGIGIKE